MLDAEEIKRQLNTKWAAGEILYIEVTDSTNNDAGKLARDGAPHGTLVVADKQEAGRGSGGRSWETPAGSNIAMSLVVRPMTTPDRIPMLTLVMGLSVAEGLDLVTGQELSGIKWPNDVVIRDRKVCGILTELHMSPEGTIADAIVGVGINVNMEDFPDEIKGVAGSLLTQTGVRADRNIVVARVMERFEENYDKFSRGWDLSLLKEQYEKKLVNKDKRVLLLDTKKTATVAPSHEVEALFAKEKEQQGTALGINEQGALLVKMDTGEIREVHAGDVSLRGMYGYV